MEITRKWIQSTLKEYSKNSQNPIQLERLIQLGISDLLFTVKFFPTDVPETLYLDLQELWILHEQVFFFFFFFFFFF